jgi:hypothetical protein
MSLTVDTQQIAKQKVHNALKLIDQAQFLLSRACGELSPVVWADKHWERIGNHMDATKQLWRDVSYSIPWEKIDLDSDAKRDLEIIGRGEE